MSSEELNKMSEQIHSQDSHFDPRNDEDYDTWEYGTEPLPGDEEWVNSDEDLDEKELYENIIARYELSQDERLEMQSEWDSILDIAGQFDSPGQAEMIWTAEKKKAYYAQKGSLTSLIQEEEEDED